MTGVILLIMPVVVNTHEAEHHPAAKGETGAGDGGPWVGNDAGVGLILWAHGRSATGTFASALLTTDHMEYCNGMKEGFKRRVLSKSTLARCIERGQYLTHIKPQHLRNLDSKLQKPSIFFPAAWESGFGILVAIFRECVFSNPRLVQVHM